MRSRERSPNRQRSSAVDIHVGKRIRLRRLFLGMDQPTFAKKLGVGFQQIQRYETGKDSVRASKLSKIAAILGVPVSDFFRGLQVEDPRTPRGEIRARMEDPETIEFLRFYFGISDGAIRQLVADLIKSIARNSGKSATVD